MAGKKALGAALVSAAAILTGAMALHQPQERTDNAYVRADITAIAAKVQGYVAEVAVDDNQRVRAGDMLFRLDDRDYQARLAQAEAAVSLAQAQLTGRDAELVLQDKVIAQTRARWRAAVAEADLAERNSTRDARLIAAAAISRAALDASTSARLRAEAGVAGALADVEAQEERVGLLEAQRDAAIAALRQAEAARDLARIDLENTVVRAPVPGRIGNRQVRVGRLVAPGVAMLDLVPEERWIVANFKETQLPAVTVGDAVRIRIDGRKGPALHGRVESLAPGSGAAFAVLPPDNATGSFIRVVQRVPVRIRIEDPVLEDLLPGLSARVEVAR